jgi:hypothetical protein
VLLRHLKRYGEAVEMLKAFLAGKPPGYHTERIQLAAVRAAVCPDSELV